MALETESPGTQADRRSAVDSALWRPQSQMPTELSRSVKIVAGDGPFLIDARGNRLLDGTASLFLSLVGHAQPALAEAAARQMKKLEFYHNYNQFYGEPADTLATRLRHLSPVADVKVFFTSGGGDAIDTACKLARLHWFHEGKPSKKYILFRQGGYHGLHGFGTAIAGIAFNRTGYGDSLIPETACVSWDDASAVEATIQELGAGNIAAIVEEPVIGSGGIYTASTSYFEAINRMAKEYEFLIIADEVITGFGRTGELWGSEKVGIRPDMIAIAKGITSGYVPLGALMVAPQIWNRYYENEQSPIFRHGLTYSGHNTACAVAHANLDLLESEGLMQRVPELEAQLRSALATVADNANVVEVRCGAGLLAAVQLPPEAPVDRVLQGALEEGVILRSLASNAVGISPPYTIEDSHVELIADAVAAGLARL